MAAAPCSSSASTKSDASDSEKRASLCRCPNKQYTAPFWSKVKQIFKGGEGNSKKNKKEGEEQKMPKSIKQPAKVKGGRICGIVVLIALFCCSSTACIIMWFTDIYLKQILEQMTVHKGSFMFDSWKKPPLKPLICVYAFNYTNLERFLSEKDGKLKVNETGPYCYRETLEKINVSFQEENGTVTYGNKRTHTFDPVHSRGNPNDILVLPNPALITAISQVKDSNYLLKSAMFATLSLMNAEVVLRVRAHDFFFGYDDNFISLTTGVARFLEIDVPFDKFGVLAIRAAETGDTLTVQTGKDDLDHIDMVTAFNGKSELDIWFGKECNRIDGSDGAFFPRKYINKSSTLYLFHQDICRRLPLVYDKDVDFQDGVMAMRFHMPSWVYNTQGTCFCRSNCPPMGIFDLSPCTHGIPLMMSFPHFLYGDPILFKKIDGLQPNVSLHDFYIDIQPSLGFTLGMVSRLQVNIQIQRAIGIPLLRQFKNNLVLPIVWVEVFADRMPADLFKVIYHATFTVKNAQLCLMYGTLILTVVTAVCIVHALWRVHRSYIKQTTLPTTVVSFPQYSASPSQQMNAIICDTSV